MACDWQSSALEIAREGAQQARYYEEVGTYHREVRMHNREGTTVCEWERERIC